MACLCEDVVPVCLAFSDLLSQYAMNMMENQKNVACRIVVYFFLSLFSGHGSQTRD